MMPLSTNYTPLSVESKWTAHWKNKKYFFSTPDNRPAFTVVIPPPNVTGVLHMGHALNETVQDILVRRARMSGYNACWVPGSDHASIATETKVIQLLEKEKGINKTDLTREQFLQHAFEWKEKYGSIIYEQIEKLGCSVDWARVTFTMDDNYYNAVIKTFVDLYNKGLIYRGARIIHWDPTAQTALSDEEVTYKDVPSILYYIKYKLADSNDYVVIATQRPETIMGDVAVCVHPEDDRYKKMQHKNLIVPLVNRKVPVIFDTYVDTTFGTGALKVTPAHDINDYNLGIKHGLPVIDILNADGSISATAQVFVGLDRFVARKKIVAQLRADNLIVKEENYTTRLGYSQRSNAVVEPRISTQWFVKMQPLATPALQAVTNENIRIHPQEKFLATYKYWLENIKDWCISRQLWWGQQIPAWYDSEGNTYVATNATEALRIAQQKNATLTKKDLRQDEDVLDTWFSSWLWPMEVFKGISQPNNSDFNYYYPSTVLVTGQDIIFFWVARMVMAGLEYKKEKPFSDVYFTGMVRDKQGRKMSKSLGNSPDVLQLIEAYGADAVRFGIMIASPAGNDLLFDESSLEQGKFFNNKLWNALKLVKIWEAKQEPTITSTPEEVWVMLWFENKLAAAAHEVGMLMKNFKISEALKIIYALVWDDFCSWYLEWIKPTFEQKIATTTYQKTITFFESLLQLLHPFMPFITEEIYHLLRTQTEDLCVKQYAITTQPINTTILADVNLLQQSITALRDARNKNQLKPKDAIKLFVQTTDTEQIQPLATLLTRHVNADSLTIVTQPVEKCIVVPIEKSTFYIQSEKKIDTAALKITLEKDLAYQKKFLESVIIKLANQKFVTNAKPALLQLEEKKKTDTLARIKTIEESLKNI